ncbi:MAG: sensor histidine kinase, partial [Chroococcales cyanobacterium]
LFQIKDQGRGIPRDKLETIFERFQQVDASDSRKKGGTGLGLAICRSIVEHHGGQIWVESVVGEGSSFFFTLPVERPNSDSGEENCDLTGAATQDLGIAVESGDRREERLAQDHLGPAHPDPRANSSTPSPIVEAIARLKPRS